jgi:fatty-acid desaturase
MVIDLSVRAILSAFLVLIAWVIGAEELVFTLNTLETNWPWLILAFLFTAIVNEWFFHIILGHTYYAKRINPNRWLYKVLICLGFGTTKGMAVMHELHHIHADEPRKDPLHWRESAISFASASPLLWVLTPAIEVDPDYIERKLNILSRIINDPWTSFSDEYHWAVTIIIWTLLYFVCPVILFKVIFMGRVIGSMVSVLINVLSHSKLSLGYKNKRGSGYNNIVIHYLLLGLIPSALHNNHHNTTLKNGHGLRWFEFDIAHWFIEKALMPLLSDKK